VVAENNAMTTNTNKSTTQVLTRNEQQYTMIKDARKNTITPAKKFKSGMGYNQ
jgi:hypothetical protein